MHGCLLHQVIELRAVARLGFLDVMPSGGQQLVDPAGGILQVAEDADLGRAGLHAGGDAAMVDAVGAEGALVPLSSWKYRASYGQAIMQ